MNENREYCKRIAAELESIYNGNELNEDGETISLYDYFADVLDFEYTINSDKSYKSVKIYVTLGGPNVWIDTSDSEVHLAWGTDRESYPIDWDLRDEIDAIFEEYYNC